MRAVSGYDKEGVEIATAPASGDTVIYITVDDGEHFRGRTLYVTSAGETAFSTLVVEGRIPGDVWLPVIAERSQSIDKAPAGDPLVLTPGATTLHVIGADYLSLRVTGTGGSFHGDPPTTLCAGLVL